MSNPVYRFLIYQRHTKMVNIKDTPEYPGHGPWWVMGPDSGRFIFVQTFDMKEEWKDKYRNVLFGMWKFPEGTVFPEFSASQLTEACLWAGKNGERVSYAIDGARKPFKEEEILTEG